MLGKLMKHEFRATARRMLPLFLVVVLLSCFLRISTAVIDHSTRSLPTILHMLNALLWVLFVLLLIGCVIFAVVVMVNRFYKNLLTDEGYLMFTLPVSIHKLLWSKLLVSSVWFLAAFAVDALALGIVLFENVSFASIPAFFKDVQDILKSQYGFDAVAFVLEYLALMLSHCWPLVWTFTRQSPSATALPIIRHSCRSYSSSCSTPSGRFSGFSASRVCWRLNPPQTMCSASYTPECSAAFRQSPSWARSCMS